MSYNYFKRRIETAQAKSKARGVDTGLVLANLYNQYTRPILVHTGPTPFQQYDGVVTEWPWMHLDETISERNICLEAATIWPLYPKFQLEINFMVIGAVFGTLIEPVDSALAWINLVFPTFSVDAWRFEDGNSDATLIATATNSLDFDAYIKAYIVREESAIRPVLNSLAFAYNIDAFDPDGQRITDELRNCISYKGFDEFIPQNFRVLIDIDMSVLPGTFEQQRAHPIYINLNCGNTSGDIIWSNSYKSGNKNFPFREAKFVRIFNVGTDIRMRGIL